MLVHAPIGRDRGSRRATASHVHSAARATAPPRAVRRARALPPSTSAPRAPRASPWRHHDARARRPHRAARPRRSTTTGTPHAIASTATRPNCSVQRGVGQRRHRDHVDRPIERPRPRSGGNRARRAPRGRRRRARPLALQQGRATSGPAPAIRSRSRGSSASASRSSVDALLGNESADEPDDDHRSSVGAVGDATAAHRRVRTAGSMPSGITRARPAKPLRSDDGGGLAIAGGDARRSAQRPPLEPAERDRVALAQVLRGVEHDGSADCGAARAAAASRRWRGRTAPRGCR